MGKTTSSKPLPKRNKSRTKSQHQHQKTYQEKFSDDIIMIDDDDGDEDLVPHIPDASNSLRNNTENVAYTSSDQSENILVQESSTDGAVSEDEEIEVIKANIYKYQGVLSYEQEVDRDILNFKYYDDFNDDDVEVIENVVSEVDDSESLEDETSVEEESILVSCDECQKLFDAEDVEEHKRDKHPPKKKNIKHFEGGNFFMIAA